MNPIKEAHILIKSGLDINEVNKRTGVTKAILSQFKRQLKEDKKKVQRDKAAWMYMNNYTPNEISNATGLSINQIRVEIYTKRDLAKVKKSLQP